MRSFFGSRRAPCDVRSVPAACDRQPSRGARRLPLSLVAFVLALPAHGDITGSVTLTGKPNSQDETFVAKANGCGESPVRHTENWKIGPKGELGDVVVWVVDPKMS